MATIKSFISLKQSRKLAEFLPLESADMEYICIDICKGLKYMPEPRFIENIPNHADEYDVKAWSLTALLSVLPVTATLLKDGNISSIGDVKYHIECPKGNIDKWFNNPVDACYEMILKLHELNLL